MIPRSSCHRLPKGCKQNMLYSIGSYDIMLKTLPADVSGARIGLMGGTFDPVHTGHLLLAQAALEECALDAVLFIPTGCSYLKMDRGISDRVDRLAMTEFAIESEPRFFISPIEVERPGNSYTADTLKELHAAYPDCRFSLILGADSVMMLDKWVRPEEICAQADLICACRDGHETDELSVQTGLLKERFSARIGLLKTGRFDISSSEIRERVRTGKSIRYLVPEPVMDYIYRKKLYRKNTGA